MPSKIKNRGNGSYLLSVAVGYDLHGHQIVKTKTIQASSRREAEKEYSLFASEVQQGLVASTHKLKLAEFAQHWFDAHVKKNLAPKTQLSYRNHLNLRILPALGHLDMQKLRPQHIMQFVDMLENKAVRYDGRGDRLSAETSRYCFRVLSSMLQDAVQWQIISSNPCTRVKPPEPGKRKPITFEDEQIQAMLAALKEEPLPFRMIILLAIDSGLRLGELMGLKWEDVDFTARTMNIVRSSQAIKGKGIFTKTPKTQSSVRKVTLSDSIMELLAAYRDWQNERKELLANQWHDGDWLFTQWNGLPMYPTTPSQWFSKFLKRHGLPHIPFHALRHLSATLLISFGVPLKNVSSRLGHTDIRTTANIYSTALQSVDRQAADKMDAYLRGMELKKRS